MSAKERLQTGQARLRRLINPRDRVGLFVMATATIGVAIVLILTSRLGS